MVLSDVVQTVNVMHAARDDEVGVAREGRKLNRFKYVSQRVESPRSTR